MSEYLTPEVTAEIIQAIAFVAITIVSAVGTLAARAIQKKTGLEAEAAWRSVEEKHRGTLDAMVRTWLASRMLPPGDLSAADLVDFRSYAAESGPEALAALKPSDGVVLRKIEAARGRANG